MTRARVVTALSDYTASILAHIYPAPQDVGLRVRYSGGVLKHPLALCGRLCRMLDMDFAECPF